MATINVSIPTSLLPAAKASGRCPPSLISDEQIIEGGAFEMAMLRALDGMTQGEKTLSWIYVGIGTEWDWDWWQLAVFPFLSTLAITGVFRRAASHCCDHGGPEFWVRGWPQ